MGDAEAAPASRPAKGGPGAAAAAAVSAAAVPVQLLNDSYAMQAARRALKRRLCDMIRLLDYMLADAIHSMLLLSLQQMLSCLHHHASSGQQQQTQAQQQDPQQQQPVAAAVVVLQVELLLHEQHDQLYLQPHVPEFSEALAVWLRSVERAVRGVPRLMSTAALQVGEVSAEGGAHTGVCFWCSCWQGS